MAVCLLPPRFRYISLTRLAPPRALYASRKFHCVTVSRSDNIVARRRFGSTSSHPPSLHPIPPWTLSVFGVEKDKRHVESWRCCSRIHCASLQTSFGVCSSRIFVREGITNSRFLTRSSWYSWRGRFFFANFRLFSLITRSISKMKQDSLRGIDPLSRVARVACVCVHSLRSIKIILE